MCLANILSLYSICQHSALGNLKENLRKQLDAFWESDEKSKIVIRGNKGSQKLSTKISENILDKKEQQIPQIVRQARQIDSYEISEPVQVFSSNFTELWAEEVLNADKWSIKTKYLQDMIIKIQHLKLQPTNHHHIIQLLRKLLDDSNFNVVLSSLKLAEALSKGLRRNFNQSAKLLFPQIILKLRDKKTQMVERAKATLKTFSTYSIDVEEVSDDLKIGLKDKSAGMRNCLINWLNDYLEIVVQAKQNGRFPERLENFLSSSALVTIVESLINDPNGEVRTSSANLMGRIISITGEDVYKQVYEKLNNKSFVISRANEGNGEGKDVNSRQKSADNRKKSVAAKNSSQSKSKLKQNSSEDYQNNSFYHLKESCLKITEVLEKNLKKINDSQNWKNRKEACDQIIKHLEHSPPEKIIFLQNLNDFLMILKNRIADPNKQLIKTFITLTGWVFTFLGEKQARTNARGFTHSLCEVFTDKNQANKLEVWKTMSKISKKVSVGHMVAILGEVLSSNENSLIRLSVLQYLLSDIFTKLEKEDSFEENSMAFIDNDNLKKQLSGYPKAILAALCDKNKQVRNLSERLMNILCGNLGIQIQKFKKEIKNQKEMHQKELTVFIDKYIVASADPSHANSFCSDSNTEKLNYSSTKTINPNNQSGLKMSKRNTSRSRTKFSNEVSVDNKLNTSETKTYGMNRSKSKGKMLTLEDVNNQKQFNSQRSYEARQYEIGPDEYFASVGTLKANKLEREDLSIRYRNKVDHPIHNQLDLQREISQLFNHARLASGMFSNNYLKTLQVIETLSRICKEVELWGQVREVWDLLVRWMGIKMYGGSCGVPAIAEGLFCRLLPILLSVLLKNSFSAQSTAHRRSNIVFTDVQIEEVIYIFRDYFMCVKNNFNMKTVIQIFKMLIELSSGDRIIHRILIELLSPKLKVKESQKSGSYQFFAIHKHLFSKDTLNNIDEDYSGILITLCCEFVDYFSNGSLLEEAAKIDILRGNEQFVGLLEAKFHNQMLRQFGFVRNILQAENLSCNISSSANNASRNEDFETKNDFSLNGGKIRNKKHEGSVLDASRDKSIKKNSKMQSVSPNPQKAVNEKSRQKIQPKPIHLHKEERNYNRNSGSPKVNLNSTHRSSSHKDLEHQQNDTDSMSYELPVSTDTYSVPSSHSPLGSNLKKLVNQPFHEGTLHFFTTLFQPQNQNSEKISGELRAHNNTIYAHLFNAFIQAMSPSLRDLHHPETVLQYPILIQQLIKCPSIFNNTLSEVLQIKSIMFTVDQLVFEDENRGVIEARLKSKGFQVKGDCFIKAVNGVMLRILDNSQPLFVFTVFLKLLIQVITTDQNQTGCLPISNKNKKIGLLMRCMNRLCNSHFSLEKESAGKNYKQMLEWCKSFVYLSKSYLDLMGTMNLQEFQIKYKKQLKKQNENPSGAKNNHTEDSIIMCICNIIKFLHYRDGTLQKVFEGIYRSDPEMREERLIKEYLEKQLKIRVLEGEDWDDQFDGLELREQLIDSRSYHFSGFNDSKADTSKELKAKVRSKNPKSQTEVLSLSSTKISSKQPSSALIRKIVSLLSRGKTFNEGIILLNDILLEFPKFNYREYFESLNLQNDFIEKVVSSVEGTDKKSLCNDREAQEIKTVLNPDIQQKLHKLKMKLEEINPSNAYPNQKMMTPSKITERHNSSLLRENATPSQKKEGTSSYTKHHDLKKRIEEMKNKVNMSTMSNNRLR